MHKRTNTTATARLKQDFLRLKKDPVPYIDAEPLPANILEWHYIVTGPEKTPFEGGIYHGKLLFPREFPFRPPSIFMITPNGRFKCNTRLCLSISDFHPDTWNPAWSVSTILTGLLSFMLEKSSTLGSVETSESTKRQLASQSGQFNLNNKTFCELFPEVAEKIKSALRKQEEEMALASSESLSTDITNAWNPNNGNAINGQQNVAIGSAFTNFIVIGGFVIFAYIVKSIIRSLNE